MGMMNVCEAFRRGWKIHENSFFPPSLPGNGHEKGTLVLLTETTLIQANASYSTVTSSGPDPGFASIVLD